MNIITPYNKHLIKYFLNIFLMCIIIWCILYAPKLGLFKYFFNMYIIMVYLYMPLNKYFLMGVLLWVFMYVFYYVPLNWAYLNIF